MSSIERFAIALYDNGFLKGNGTEINDLLEYYKEISKDDLEAAIIEAFDQGVIAEFTHQVSGAPETSGQEYFNQTYGDGIQ